MYDCSSGRIRLFNMKKFLIASSVLFAGYLIACSPTRNAQQTPSAEIKPTLAYTSDVQPLIMPHCSPCHIEGKGNKTPYNNYANAKRDIDDILLRINKNPDEKGFMPFRHPKLSDSA